MRNLINKKKKIIAGVALAVITVGAFVGITRSKYTNQVTGDGQTEIAKFYFDVDGETEEIETIYLADTYDASTLINGKIAPGTSGSFDLVIHATDSEVGVKYEVDFQNETNKPTNLKFKHGSDRFNEIEDLEEFLTDTIDADDEDKERTLTVEWEWLYDSGDDTTDTNEGLAALDYSFDVVVTGTQVVPSK